MSEKRYLHCRPICTDGCYRMNQVERLPDGRLFTLACFGKTNSGGHFSKEPVSQFLMGRVSSDEGKTWKTPTFVYEIPEKDAMTLLGEFMIDRAGKIHVFFLRISHLSWEAGTTKGDIAYIRMDDEKGTNLIFKKIECLDRYTGALNNLIQLESGRIIVPFSTLSGANGSTFVSSVIYTDDGGDTWKASNDVSVVSDEAHLESGAVEPVVVEARPGVLVMLIRTVLNRIWYSVSYDEGAVWTQAKPTLIPSSNAPSVPLRLRDGRILLSWNNVLGEPMQGVRYSFARQCLHAAVSDDGLKTLKGVRIIVKKRACDPDEQLNCYPFASDADGKEIFLRPFSVNNDDVHWGEAQGTLLRMDPDDLLAREMTDGFDEWVTDCETDAGGIHLKPGKGNIAYACVNFPYAAEGVISLATAQKEVPGSARLLLSDCYLDRLNFLPEKKQDGYADVVGKPYVEVPLHHGGDIRISWDGKSLKVTDGGRERTIPMAEGGRGFNHMIVLFEGEGNIDIRSFRMTAIREGMPTGIEY